MDERSKTLDRELGSVARAPVECLHDVGARLDLSGLHE